MFHSRVTLKQIAEEAGVHVSTVWRALKNDTYVAPEQRSRIRQIATRLGYAPDPMLSALSTYRRRQQPPTYRSTLAWVNNFPQRADCLEAVHIRAYHEGATALAASMGYRLEEFWLREQGMTPKRAREVLLARGIRGLLFAPQQLAATQLRLNLDAFACVSLGYSLVSPRVHVVTNHQHSSTLMCLRQLCARGHSRIGMVATTEMLRRAEHNFETPYSLLQQAQPEHRRIPLFEIAGRHEPVAIHAAREKFLAWFERYRPTAIVGTVPELQLWLDAVGYRMPDDISFATLSRIITPQWSGIDQQEREIGARAVELLISLFQSGERGPPAAPLRLLVEGKWIDHGTVRTIGPPEAELLERIS